MTKLLSFNFDFSFVGLTTYRLILLLGESGGLSLGHQGKWADPFNV